MLDAIMIPLLIVGVIAALWHNTGWKLFQLAIVCAVAESDYFWHWAPPHSIAAPIAGVALAALLTYLLSLAGLTGQPSRLLRRDHSR